jgi:hypothetical protein
MFYDPFLLSRSEVVGQSAPENDKLEKVELSTPVIRRIEFKL